MQSRALPFRAFRENHRIRIYFNGHLPHWRQVGCTYFVTFRLADSVPQTVLKRWSDERDRWLIARGKNSIGQLTDAERRQLEERSFVRLDEYLDRGVGSCGLRSALCAQIVAQGLDFFHGTRVNTGDYVIMPNHVHALLTPLPGFELEGVLQSIKSFTAKSINRQIGSSGNLWQRDSYDHIVRDWEQLENIQSYVRENPRKAGLDPITCRLHKASYLPRRSGG